MKKTLDELDALHTAATAGEWRVEHDRVDQPNIHAEHGEWVALLPHQCLISLEVMANANAASIAALHNAWPSVSARLRAAEVEVERLRGALRGMLRAHPNCHSVNCGGYGCDDDYLTDDPDGDTGGDIHVCECGAITARNAARAALGEP